MFFSINNFTWVYNSIIPVVLHRVNDDQLQMHKMRLNNVVIESKTNMIFFG